TIPRGPLVLRRIRHHRRGVRTATHRAVRGHRRSLGGRRRLLRLLATARREGREGQRHQRQSKKLTHRVHVHLLSRCRPVECLGRPCFSVSKSMTQKKTPLNASGVGPSRSRSVSCKSVCGPPRRTFSPHVPAKANRRLGIDPALVNWPKARLELWAGVEAPVR